MSRSRPHARRRSGERVERIASQCRLSLESDTESVSWFGQSTCSSRTTDSHASKEDGIRSSSVSRTSAFRAFGIVSAATVSGAPSSASSNRRPPVPATVRISPPSRLAVPRCRFDRQQIPERLVQLVVTLLKISYFRLGDTGSVPSVRVGRGEVSR